MEILRVAAKSDPVAVSRALVIHLQRNRYNAEIQAIGAGAVNQAIKAVAIARSCVASQGVDLICIPGFTKHLIDGEECTAIILFVARR